MSKNIVFEGWLTKSPPSKRIWRTKWRRRWFALRQSGELPGQYFLDYYADRNYRRLKGTINLDLCEQVDAGLHMERTGNGSLDPKLRGSVFTIQTQSRTYHLEADCEAEMERWVEAICRVCGLRSTEEDDTGPYQSSPNVNNVSGSEQTDSTDTTGPYIPISECITGVRAQDSQRAFTFDPKNIVTSTRHLHLETFDPPKFAGAMAKSTLEKVDEVKENAVYQGHPNKCNNHDSDNDSSDDECKSLNTSQLNIRTYNMKEYAVDKTFAKFALSPTHNGFLDDVTTAGPPVPPRPPKTFTLSKEIYPKEPYQGPKIQEPPEVSLPEQQTFYGNAAARRLSQSGGPPSPIRPILASNVVKTFDDDEDVSPNHQSLQYCNLPTLPPVVDRNLKPRPASHNLAAMNVAVAGSSGVSVTSRYEARSDTLQYLDLDLVPKNSPTMIQDGRKVEIAHRKSSSAADADCAYKTVDFLKTEAFNITRQDAEASRSVHY